VNEIEGAKDVEETKESIKRRQFVKSSGLFRKLSTMNGKPDWIGDLGFLLPEGKLLFGTYWREGAPDLVQTTRRVDSLALSFFLRINQHLLRFVNVSVCIVDIS